MVSLKGAAVVVTGASSGIGLAVAERFVASGARVMTGSRSEPPDGLGRWVRTDVADSVFDVAADPVAARAATVERHPVGRLGRPLDVAALVLWRASDEASFVSGSPFTIDGGLTAQTPIPA